MLDLIIRNGRIVDGTGASAFDGDVAIQDGKIVAVGEVTGDAKQEIDAVGKVVSPGFIDPHTHFDAQLLWDGYAKPAIEHGVTTIVPGNCSLSLAPLKLSTDSSLLACLIKLRKCQSELLMKVLSGPGSRFLNFSNELSRVLPSTLHPSWATQCCDSG